jgi:hypothetical protein
MEKNKKNSGITGESFEADRSEFPVKKAAFQAAS